MSTYDEDSMRQAALIAAQRLLNLPVPVDSSKTDVHAAAAEILASVDEMEEMRRYFESVGASVLKLPVAEKRREILAQTAEALRKLTQALDDDCVELKAGAWCALPADVRAEALRLRRAANDALLELISEGEFLEAADIEWNDGEATLSEAITWDMDGAAAFGIDLSYVVGGDIEEE